MWPTRSPPSFAPNTREPIQLVPPGDASPARVDVGLFDTVETEVEFLATRVGEMHAAVEKRRTSAGGSDESIAVLCTTGKNIRRVDRALRARGFLPG